MKIFKRNEKGFDLRSSCAQRAARIEYLGEDKESDPEFKLFISEDMYEAGKVFIPFISSLLAGCAGIESLQIKAVSRILSMCEDNVIYRQCPDGIQSSVCTLAAMANPISSFRESFQKMGGLSSVGLCYLDVRRSNFFFVFFIVFS